MAKHLLLKHYRRNAGPEDLVGIPMDQWSPAEIDAHITYEAAVRPGDRLLARATETHRGRRTAVYRIDVVRPADPGRPERHVSSFTGTVFLAG